MSFCPDKALELLRRGLRRAGRHPRVRAVMRQPWAQEARRRANQARYDAGKEADRIKRWQRRVQLEGEHRVNEWRRTGDLRELFKRETSSGGGEVGEEGRSGQLESPPRPLVAKIPFVVTRATRKALKAQGFSLEAVRDLRPAEAMALVERNIHSGPEAEEFLRESREREEREEDDDDGGKKEEEEEQDPPPHTHHHHGEDDREEEGKKKLQGEVKHLLPQRISEDMICGTKDRENPKEQKEHSIAVVEEEKKKEEEERG